jgi:hypothetical protein
MNVNGKQLSQIEHSISLQQSVALTGNTMKFEITFGWLEAEKITVETYDFEKIKIIQEFIEFQEEHDWAVDYEAIDSLEIEFEEDTEEEEVAE